MMRTYIITKLEEEYLIDYLLKGTTPDAFYVLLNRIQVNQPTLKDQIELIQKVLTKRENELSN